METQSTEAVVPFPEPTLVPDGIHHLLDETVYRRDPAIAISDLKEMSISPAHFYSKKFGGYRAEQTGAQYIGTLTHLSVLEAEEYAKRIVLEPVDAPRKPTSAQINAKKPSDETIAAIKWWEDWNKEHGHKTMLSQDEAAQISGITGGVQLNPDAMQLMSGAMKEVAMFKTIMVNGRKIRIKGKADIICDPKSKNAEVIADLKTVDRGYANPDDFSYSIKKWGYAQQAAWYIDLYNMLTATDDPFTADVKKSRWVFVVAEKLPPYVCITLELDEDSIEAGRDINKRHLETLAECFKTDVWERPLNGVRGRVSIPEWAKKKS
jgi:exodeoxyribonuclease VIII